MLQIRFKYIDGVVQKTKQGPKKRTICPQRIKYVKNFNENLNFNKNNGEYV